jgi:hypothetical protein
VKAGACHIDPCLKSPIQHTIESARRVKKDAMASRETRQPERGVSRIVQRRDACVPGAADPIDPRAVNAGLRQRAGRA